MTLNTRLKVRGVESELISRVISREQPDVTKLRSPKTVNVSFILATIPCKHFLVRSIQNRHTESTVGSRQRSRGENQLEPSWGFLKLDRHG